MLINILITANKHIQFTIPSQIEQVGFGYIDACMQLYIHV